MTSTDLHGLCVKVLGCGTGTPSRQNEYSARVKSLVRYADPSAWAVVEAMDHALRLSDVISARQAVGVLLVSDEGPRETVATIATTAKSGLVSPMRFPAATPASLIGVACIVFGFQGPTLNLSMSVAGGVPIMSTIAKNWLQREVVDFVFLNTYATDHNGDAHARSVLLSRLNSEPPSNSFPLEQFFGAGNKFDSSAPASPPDVRTVL